MRDLPKVVDDFLLKTGGVFIGGNASFEGIPDIVQGDAIDVPRQVPFIEGVKMQVLIQGVSNSVRSL